MIVYLLTSPSGKKYVGITSRTLEKRWIGHCSKARKGSNLAIHCAIRKYGEESIKVELLEVVESWEEACAREQFWIAELGSKAPSGYNLTDGGDGLLGLKHSKESRERMRKPKSEAAKERMRGRKFSDTHRARLSASASSRIVSDQQKARLREKNLGSSRSAEVRQRMSEAQKLRWARYRGEV